MAIEFSYVPPISPGDPVTSTQLAAIADALNSRLRPNLGDVCERIVSYVWYMFRALTTEDPEADFFQRWQNIKATDAQWPAAAPDDPGGVNTGSLMGAFVFGSASLAVDSEDVRITDTTGLYGNPEGPPLFVSGHAPASVQDYWDLGKAQRGAVDLSTGLMGSPAFDAAISHYKIRPGPNSRVGLSWGGYMPSPVTVLPDCTDGTDTWNSYQIVFTKLGVSHTTCDGTNQICYPGTCPGTAGNVLGQASTPTEYLVYIDDGTGAIDHVDVYPRSEWIEGPYTGGGYVKRQEGLHLPRVLNSFCGDFNGTDSEYASQETWLQYAFDTNRFMVSQYFLAPARGTDNGDGTITEIYPTGSKTLASGVTTLPTGTIIQISSADTYAIHSGYALGAILFTTSRLKEPCDVQVLNDGALVAEVTLTPDGSGNAPTIQTFEIAPTGSIQVRLGTDANFYNDTGSISLELAELREQKPQGYDLALCLRLASCRTSLVNDLDGSGRDEATAKGISDAYFASACISNTHGDAGPPGSADAINTNSVFDNARRLSKCVRAVSWDNGDGTPSIIGYEVTDGKSICYFKRLREVSPGVNADLFEGIAPPREEVLSGAIEASVSYIVRNSSISYNGATVAADSVFVGVSGVDTFSGSGNVYEYDGIISSARQGGMTNEWLMSAWLKGYDENSGNTFSIDGLFRTFWFSDRCNFYHPPAPSGFNGNLQQQFDYGSTISYAPESFSGWRYAKDTNRWTCDDTDTDCKDRRRDRYKSCRIYEPMPEIESATVLIESGVEVVKLVFKSRFHYHDTLAPASVARDRSTWNITDLRTESTSYRTFENAIREYLHWTDDGTDCVGGGEDGIPLPTGNGNAAFQSEVWTLSDKPMGSCFPDFYFLKLFPKPYDDGNDFQDDWDTPLMGDWWKTAELYIRAMCEGYVDGLTSQQIGCSTGQNAVYCYTLASLCFEAFNGSWFNAVAQAETEWIATADTRSDNPEGFGQLPNIWLSSEIYNQFASALNKLNKVQIMLPMLFQVRTGTSSADAAVAATWSNDPPHNCSDSGVLTPAYYTGSPPAAGAPTMGAWSDASSAVAGNTASIVCDECSGSNWILRTIRTDAEWRWALADPDAAYAVPETLREMVFGPDGEIISPGRVLSVNEVITTATHVERLPSEDGASPCLGGDFGYWHDSTVDPEEFLAFNNSTLSDVATCTILSPSGTIIAPSLGESDFSIGRTTGDACCMFSATNSRDITPTLGDDTTFIEIPVV